MVGLMRTGKDHSPDSEEAFFVVTTFHDVDSHSSINGGMDEAQPLIITGNDDPHMFRLTLGVIRPRENDEVAFLRFEIGNTSTHVSLHGRTTRQVDAEFMEDVSRKAGTIEAFMVGISALKTGRHKFLGKGNNAISFAKLARKPAVIVHHKIQIRLCGCFRLWLGIRHFGHDQINDQEYCHERQSDNGYPHRIECY